MEQIPPPRDFRLQPQCKSDLHSSGILRSVDLQLVTHAAGNPIDPIFEGQKVQDPLPLNMGPIGCPEAAVANYQSTQSKTLHRLS
jgi:hypothetical protein